jgi:hypothetical protein
MRMGMMERNVLRHQVGIGEVAESSGPSKFQGLAIEMA